MMMFVGRVIDAIWIAIELRRAPATDGSDTWDAAFAEARRWFPADRFQQEVAAIVELQRRALRGERRHDA